MRLKFDNRFAWGEPTFFLRKINAHPVAYSGSEMVSTLSMEQTFVITAEYKKRGVDIHPKIHAICKDAGSELKAGEILEMVYCSENASPFRFAKVKITDVQAIEIGYQEVMPGYRTPYVFVDEKMLFCKEIDMLVKNDGFLSRAQFFQYFDKPFLGKIIHWTDFQY